MTPDGYNPGAAEDPTTSPDIVDPDEVVEEPEDPSFGDLSNTVEVVPEDPNPNPMGEEIKDPLDGSEGTVPFAQ